MGQKPCDAYMFISVDRVHVDKVVHVSVLVIVTENIQKSTTIQRVVYYVMILVNYTSCIEA